MQLGHMSKLKVNLMKNYKEGQGGERIECDVVTVAPDDRAKLIMVRCYAICRIDHRVLY